MVSGIRESIRRVYEVMHDDPMYLELWETLFPEDKSMHILTILDFDDACREVNGFKEHIMGKRVVELGAGVGLLAYEMSKYAELVVAVEHDPLWARVYLKHVYPRVLREKLPLLYVIGDARYLEHLNTRFNTAVVYSYSALDMFLDLANKLSSKTILNGKVIP